MKIFYTIVFYILLFGTAFSQVGINTDMPSPASVLDVEAENNGNFGGFMPPRVTLAERDLIPATLADDGMLVYVIDAPSNIRCVQIFNGQDWENVFCQPVNSKPEALNVSFTGNLTVGSVLTGSSTYFDQDEDPESGSTVQWYFANAPNDIKTPIAGATGSSYRLTASEEDKYISYAIIPRAATGESPGDEVFSAERGPVQPNEKPEANSVNFDGIVRVNEELFSSYIYSDTEFDTEIAPAYQWYTQDDLIGTGRSPIPGAVNNSYLLTVNELNDFIGVSVTPASAAPGTSPGDETFSSFKGPVAAAGLVQNRAPVAGSVSFSGVLVEGEVLTGTYMYSDNENDAEDSDPVDGTELQWYSAINDIGDDLIPISGANNLTYTLQSSDIGRHISFSVTPDAVAGITPGQLVMTAFSAASVQGNQLPVASNLIASGTTEVGEALTANYAYSDAEGDGENNSDIQWYRADNASGGNRQVISGATATTYTLQGQDFGKFVGFSVTPNAITGASPGLTVFSDVFVGQITVSSNDAPVASTPTISGTLEVDETLTGTFSYSDTENDPQGNHFFEWLRADDASGTNATVIQTTNLNALSDTYDLVAADETKFIALRVTPVATTGTSPGNSSISAYSGPINAAPSGPITIGIQDFETSPATPTLSLTENNPGTYQTGNGSFPNSPKFVSGSRGYGISNGNVDIDLGSVDASSYTDATVKFKLASFAGTSGNGSDTGDYVDVYISLDGGATFSYELEILGNNNAKWDFDATGTVTLAYDGDDTRTTFQPTNGGNLADGFANIEITGIPNSANLVVGIVMLNNSGNETWVIDDVEVIGN